MNENESENELVYTNGVDAMTGGYLTPPMTPAQLAAFARGETTDPDLAATLKRAAEPAGPHLGLPADLDPLDIAQAGWGLVLAADEDPAVKEGLAPLLDLRRRQVTDPDRFKELDYLEGESRRKWLARRKVGGGADVDPTRVPYYLLVVGCPAKIPLDFCRQLSVNYVVGILSFDTPAEYEAYARGVVAAETNGIKPRSRRVTFFAPRHASDPATQMSADRLVKPLSEGTLGDRAACGLEAIWGDAARHGALADVLARDDETAPAFLFTASHGLGFPAGHADQRAQQGALICQDWGGPAAGRIGRGQYFTAADVPDDANVAGMFALLFACYSGGTPERDRYADTRGEQPPVIAEAAFAAALPQRLLAHPAGGAVGCIAHFERATGYSIVDAGPRLIPYENAVINVLGTKNMAVRPIGLALKEFNETYAVLSTSLTGMLKDIGNGLRVPEVELARAWRQRNDAEGYVLFGDPAARARVEEAA
jgi:hypothetical protein